MAKILMNMKMQKMPQNYDKYGVPTIDQLQDHVIDEEFKLKQCHL